MGCSLWFVCFWSLISVWTMLVMHQHYIILLLILFQATPEQYETLSRGLNRAFKDIEWYRGTTKNENTFVCCLPFPWLMRRALCLPHHLLDEQKRVMSLLHREAILCSCLDTWLNNTSWVIPAVVLSYKERTLGDTRYKPEARTRIRSRRSWATTSASILERSSTNQFLTSVDKACLQSTLNSKWSHEVTGVREPSSFLHH